MSIHRHNHPIFVNGTCKGSVQFLAMQTSCNTIQSF